MPTSADLRGCVHLSDPKPMRGASPAALVTLDNLEPIAGPRGGDVSFECLPYQLSMVLSVPTMVTTGNGESGFDSGEGA
uniref:Plasminogen n=1 Tax=Sander lucioperca TaxID=283035 RepID=A0A8C9XGT2_SANLU